MPHVFLQPQFRDLTGGVADVRVEGATLGQVIDALEARFPGIARRLLIGGAIAPGLAVSVDGVVSSRGVLTKVRPDSEIHFLPAIGGG